MAVVLKVMPMDTSDDDEYEGFLRVGFHPETMQRNRLYI
jgi:hypothetical protein